MEHTVLVKIWAGVLALMKWLFPAALGAAVSLFTDGSEPKLTKFEKSGYFLGGIAIASFFGAFLIAVYEITTPQVQGVIYFSIGIWGMGVIIQVKKQLPSIVDAASKIVLRLLERFVK